MLKRSRQQSDAAVTTVTTHNKVRVVVRTEIEYPQNTAGSGTNDLCKRILDVIAVDQKRLEREMDKAVSALVQLDEAWCELEDKLEEVHGDTFVERLASYPMHMDEAVTALKDAVQRLKQVVRTNGEWIALSRDRVDTQRERDGNGNEAAESDDDQDDG
ncbi:hypothetical protein CC1G_14517 [Coprinopsis cinerea okayama7|uniref:Uncharacterized protein n=1 Tax=Coprinopsis cinerea (strain Okayama-7 / 130 / ATCC MYA-4618 / FGSC 9003) TaxID=240176 RepID=D6RM57_COPC7|nr:hypothetical protein CC1G_14517 [Coprinopsis cinerea okayama7\|eukprot:XP_002911518.1 hypothetical protein CC1G_14517 [Coprinopsis cinerea okayama7\